MNKTPFESFADIYPHEAYGSEPEKFWEYFHRLHPDWSREQVNELLFFTQEGETVNGTVPLNSFISKGIHKASRP